MTVFNVLATSPSVARDEALCPNAIFSAFLRAARRHPGDRRHPLSFAPAAVLHLEAPRGLRDGPQQAGSALRNGAGPTEPLPGPAKHRQPRAYRRSPVRGSSPGKKPPEGGQPLSGSCGALRPPQPPVTGRRPGPGPSAPPPQPLPGPCRPPTEPCGAAPNPPPPAAATHPVAAGRAPFVPHQARAAPARSALHFRHGATALLQPAGSRVGKGRWGLRCSPLSPRQAPDFAASRWG